jgi:hypothetical protein
MFGPGNRMIITLPLITGITGRAGAGTGIGGLTGGGGADIIPIIIGEDITAATMVIIMAVTTVVVITETIMAGTMAAAVAVAVVIMVAEVAAVGDTGASRESVRR